MMSVYIVMFIAFASVCGRTYDPVELAVAFDSSGASYWNVPFLVCLSHATSNLTEISSGGAAGVFALPPDVRRNCTEGPYDAYDFPEIAADVACVQKILKSDNPVRELRKVYSSDVEFDTCFDWWHELPQIPSPDPPSCENSTYLTLTLLLIVFDSLLAFLCFVLFLYVRNSKCGIRRTD